MLFQNFVRAVLAWEGVEFSSFCLGGLKQSLHMFEGCETQKRRMVWVGRVFEDHLVQPKEKLTSPVLPNQLLSPSSYRIYGFYLGVTQSYFTISTRG